MNSLSNLLCFTLFCSIAAFSAPSALAEFGDSKQLSHNFSSNEFITDVEISADSERVIYLLTSSNANRLYSAPINGSEVGVNLTGSRYLRRYAMSPDGKTVVISTSNSAFDSANQLVSQATDLSSPATTLAPILSGGRDFSDFEITPDNNSLVFISEERTNNLKELWSVPIAGPSGDRIRLSGDINPPANSSEVVGISSFMISPDSSRAVYSVRQTGDTAPEIYSVALDGSSEPVRLTDNSSAGFNVASGTKIITPDSSKLVFISDFEAAGRRELFVVPITGPNTSVTKLSQDTGVDAVSQALISPDGLTIIFTARGSDNKVELYSVPIDGSTDPVKLNPELVEFGNVKSDFRITNDSSSVVFTADLDIDRVDELFKVPIAGPSVQTVKLNADYTTGQSVSRFELSDDELSVVFIREETNSGFRQSLFRALVDGSQTPVKLNAEAIGAERIAEFDISPDGSYVTFRAPQDIENVNELYLAPVGDNDSETQKLNDPLPEGGRVGSGVAISPDSNNVVYLAEQNLRDRFELFVVKRSLTSGSDDELCVAIKSESNKVVTFCL